MREEYARFLDGRRRRMSELEPLKQIYVTGTTASGCGGRRRWPPICSRLALHDFPDDYLATYEQRVRGYGRAAVEADVRAAFPKPPLTVVVVAPSAEGLAADCVIKAPEELARCE